MQKEAIIILLITVLLVVSGCAEIFDRKSYTEEWKDSGDLIEEQKEQIFNEQENQTEQEKP